MSDFTKILSLGPSESQDFFQNRKIKQTRRIFRESKNGNYPILATKDDFAILPSAAHVRSALLHCVLRFTRIQHGSRNDLTQCRMLLYVDYASVSAPTSSKHTTSTSTSTRGSRTPFR